MKLLIVLACMIFMSASWAFAETQAPVIAKLSLEEHYLKSGEILNIAISLHNVSTEEVRIDLIQPYSAYPEVTNTQTGASASLYKPSYDGMAQQQTIVLKPDQTLEFIRQRIKSVDNLHIPSGGVTELQKLLVSDAVDGFIDAVPGSYSIKFKLNFESITGMSSPVIEIPPETFEIIK